MPGYTMTVHVAADPAAAEEQVRTALQEQGFGVLSVIDVQAALLDKLGEDIGHYTILGACNPPLARQALEADADIGALLPCNVVLRAHPDGGTDVVAADPAAMLELAGEGLGPVAADARRRLQAALDDLA